MRIRRKKKQPNSQNTIQLNKRSEPPIQYQTEQVTDLPTLQQQAQQPGRNFGDISIFSAEQSANLVPLQAKLTIGQPNDKYEWEADRVAADVVQTINSPEANQPLQRAEEEKVQTKSLHLQADGMTAAVGAAPPQVEKGINQAKGGGHPLASNLQQKMGNAMGADFSRVRVHTDNNADKLNESIQAKAFTTGRDVFFKQGAYQPRSQEGQKLIAHELTHVVQQTGNNIQRQPNKQEIKQDINNIQHTIQRTIVDNEGSAEIWGREIAPNLEPLDDNLKLKIHVLHSVNNKFKTTSFQDLVDKIQQGDFDPFINKIIQQRNIKDLQDAKFEDDDLPQNSSLETFLDVTESISDGVASGSGITGDVADTTMIDKPEDYQGDHMDRAGGASLNNPVCDIAEGANMGLGAVNIFSGIRDLKADKDSEVSKIKASAQVIEGTGQTAHGGAKLAKGIALNGGGNSGDWTQVGDVGAGLSDLGGTIASVILLTQNIKHRKRKNQDEGGLTQQESIDSAANTTVNVLDAAQSGLNTAKDVVKVVGKVGGSPSDGIQSAVSGMATTAGIIGAVVGAIQVAHGAYTTLEAQGKQKDIHGFKATITDTIIKLDRRIKLTNFKISQKRWDFEDTEKPIILLKRKLELLQIAIAELEQIYQRYAPTLDAMSKIQSQRMAQGKMKMAQGTVGVVSGILAATGVGLPIAISVAAIGGIMALGGVVVNWKRNQESESLMSKVAPQIDPNGNPQNPLDEVVTDYNEMSSRVYKCYYGHLKEVMEERTTLGSLDEESFWAVKNFAWGDKKSRIDSDDRYSVYSLDEVPDINDIIKRNKWIQVQQGNTVTHKEKPKNADKRKFWITPSAHKSQAAMEASADVIAEALYQIGIESYSDQSFVSRPVVTSDVNDSVENYLSKSVNLDSTTLLGFADITPERWKAWLNKTQGDREQMIPLIKSKVLGKKSPKVKARGARGIRDYD